MDWDSASLFLTLFISTVGFSYFIYGKKRPAYPFMFVGAIMMVYGYFLTSFWLTLLIGAVLAVVPFFIR